MEILQLGEGADLTLSLKGRLDTNTAPLLEKALEGIDQNVEHLVFDFADLEYISSAGLRVLVVSKKKIADTSVINANSMVFEVLETTGLSSLIDVSSPGQAASAGLDYALSFRDFLRRGIARHPDESIVFCPGHAYTWAEIGLASEEIAHRLAAAGVKRHAHVGICGANGAGWIFTFFAIQKLGAIAVLLNPTLKASELRQLLELGDIAYLCVGSTDHSVGDELGAVFDFSDEALVRMGVDAACRASFAPDRSDFCVPIEADDPAIMIFSSGTTSLPKAVLLSSYHLFNNCNNHCEVMGLSGEDRQCLVMPLFHIFGFSCMLTSLMRRAPLYLPQSTHSADVLELLERERCTVMHSVPTLMLAIAISASFAGHDVSALRSTLLAGAPLAPRVLHFLQEKFPNNTFGIMYGLSEIAPVSATLYDTDDPDARRSVGRPLKGVYVQIADTETRKTCAVGEPGEVLVKSPNQMVCYYKLPIERQPYDGEGWLHTGDLGYLSEGGYLHLIGRSKDLIIRGGENIAPDEVAAEVAEHPSVVDVKVLGVPSDFWGEEVCACLVLVPGASFDRAQMDEFLSSRLAKFKLPTRYVLFDKFPLLGNGKLDVRSIKETAERRVASSS